MPMKRIKIYLLIVFTICLLQSCKYIALAAYGTYRISEDPDGFFDSFFDVLIVVLGILFLLWILSSIFGDKNK